MFEKGMNLVQINMLYSEGYSAELVAQAFKESGLNRKDIVIFQAIYLNDNKGLEDSKVELQKVMELFETDYIDILQFSMDALRYCSFEEMTSWLDELFAEKKIKFTSVTNENLDFLKKYHQKYGDRLFSHEVMFNFEVKVNEELGIIPYALENDIQTIVYQPLRRNRTAKHNWKPLVDLSEKYNKTQNQILLNWIVNKGYLPLTKSENLSHIDEHIEALSFEMDEKDYEILNSFVIPDYKQPSVDWDRTGDGVTIDQLSNAFDEDYSRQVKLS